MTRISTLQGEFAFYKVERSTDDIDILKKDRISKIDYEQDYFSMRTKLKKNSIIKQCSTVSVPLRIRMLIKIR